MTYVEIWFWPFYAFNCINATLSPFQAKLVRYQAVDPKAVGSRPVSQKYFRTLYNFLLIPQLIINIHCIRNTWCEISKIFNNTSYATNGNFIQHFIIPIFFLQLKILVFDGLGQSISQFCTSAIRVGRAMSPIVMRSCTWFLISLFSYQHNYIYGLIIC